MGHGDAPRKTPRLHIFCFATHSSGYFPALKESADRLGLTIDVVGMGQKWSGFGTKMRCLRDYLKQKNPNDVILSIDAFDVILLQPEQVIIERFLAMQQPIIGGAEGQRWLALAFHNALFRSKGYDDVPWPSIPDNVPKALHHLQLLNVGTMMGYVHALTEVLAAVPDHGEFNDQRFLTEYCFEGKIAIDHGCHLFHLFRTNRALKLMSADEARQLYPYKHPLGEQTTTMGPNGRIEGEFMETDMTKNGVLVDTEAGTVPCVLHMHCRNNVDHICKALMLPPTTEKAKLSDFLQYSYYSLKAHVGAHNAAPLLFVLSFVLSFLGVMTLMTACAYFVSTAMKQLEVYEAAGLVLKILLLISSLIFSCMSIIIKHVNRPRSGKSPGKP